MRFCVTDVEIDCEEEKRPDQHSPPPNLCSPDAPIFSVFVVNAPADWMSVWPINSHRRQRPQRRGVALTMKGGVVSSTIPSVRFLIGNPVNPSRSPYKLSKTPKQPPRPHQVAVEFVWAQGKIDKCWIIETSINIKSCFVLVTPTKAIKPKKSFNYWQYLKTTLKIKGRNVSLYFSLLIFPLLLEV